MSRLSKRIRRFTERYQPAIDRIAAKPLLRRLVPSLVQPDLWHLNRRSTARAVAIGLLCGLIPGPFQILGSAALCVVWRANVPLAFLTTFYTNPLTIVPIYFVAYRYGALFVPGARADAALASPPPFEMSLAYLHAVTQWALGLGTPLAIGIPLLAFTLAAAGYAIVSVAWRLHVRREWRRRSLARRPV